MDPSETDLAAMNTLEAVFDWAGVAADLRTTLGASLGRPTLIRDIVFIDRATWDGVIAILKGHGPVPAAGGAPPERDLSPLDKSRLEMFRRACMLRAGAVPDTPGAAPVAGVAPAAGPPGALGGPPSGRKLKLSAVVDQSLDAEVTPLPPTEIQAMFDAYKLKYGDMPAPETADQLAAIKQLVVAKAVPYIDFAVYGPHGLRLLRKLTFSSHTLNANGEWARKELPGPPDFDTWFGIFRCMKAAFLLLEIATTERIDGYCEHVRGMYQRFGQQCWDIIYTADIHMRSEEFERLRRRLTGDPLHGFTQANPWNAVMAQAVKEDAFWSKEVITPCTLRLAQQSSPGGMGGSPQKAPPTAPDHAPPAKKAKRQEKYEGENKSKWDGSRFTHNRRGVEICQARNNGKCGKPTPQSKCMAKPPRSHQCNKCLGPHLGKDCVK